MSVYVCWRSVGIVAVQGLLDPVALYKVSVGYTQTAAVVNCNCYSDWH